LAALAATLALPALPAQAQPATAGATLAAVRAKRRCWTQGGLMYAPPIR
jgi:hypothetical protein